jgi:hypothetical protein
MQIKPNITRREGIAPKNPASTIERWDRAAAAMPLCELIQMHLAGTPGLGIIDSLGPEKLVMITSENLNRMGFESTVGNLSVVLTATPRRLTDAEALRAVCLLHRAESVRAEGDEVDALDSLYLELKTESNIYLLPKNMGETPREGLFACCAHAARWRRETLEAAKSYLKTMDLLSKDVPEAVLCVSTHNSADAITLSILRSEGENAVMLEGQAMGRNSEDIRTGIAVTKSMVKTNILQALGQAGNACATAYVLYCAAKLAPQEAVLGLNDTAGFGIENVKHYLRLSEALRANAGAELGSRERMAGGILKLVGLDLENEVREHFGVPRAVKIRQPETPKPEAAAAPRPAPQPACRQHAQPLTAEQKVSALERELPDVPTDFIAGCVEANLLKAEKIRAKYQEVSRHAPELKRMQRKPGEQAYLQETAPLCRKLEERIASITFEPEMEAAIRSRGLEPIHVSLVLCKAFGYPAALKPSTMDKIADHLAGGHPGKLRNPARTANSVLNFMDSVGLLTYGEKTVSVNAGPDNAAGSAILKAVREAFPETVLRFSRAAEGVCHAAARAG